MKNEECGTCQGRFETALDRLSKSWGVECSPETSERPQNTPKTQTEKERPKALKIPSKIQPGHFEPIPWETYYKECIEEFKDLKGEDMDGNGITPDEICDYLDKPVIERYFIIKTYRIMLYDPGDRKEMTRIFYDLETVCASYFFPAFFVLDFEKYQNEREWKINGQPIRNIKGAFYKWANAKRSRMIEAETWEGDNMEKYRHCGAWEL